MSVDNSLRAVVLAAGKGTRLLTGDSDSPKVMRTVCGRPLLWYVLDALTFICKENIVIVVGYKKHEIMDQFPGYAYAVQEEQLGTGHAVMAARHALEGFNGVALICYGDMPAVKRETYQALANAHIGRGNGCTILTGESSVQLPYGRILRDSNGDFLHVVEDRDCTPEQREIKELNSGVYVFQTPLLLEALKDLRNDNAQSEYYLTDVPAILRSGGSRVGILKRSLGDEIIGVNTPQQLAQVEMILSNR